MPDANETTVLAAYLNARMARDHVARATYERIYGEPWQPLGTGFEDFNDRIDGSTTAKTKG